MSVTSVEFLGFITVLLTVYWIIPGRFQWVLLLAASSIFYVLNAPMFTLIYIGISVSSVYYATMYFENGGKNKKIVLIGTLIVVLGILAVLKYTNLFAGTLCMILKIPYARVNWIAPLAISFYTLQLVAYTLDCYWGVAGKTERNIFKLLLYTIYFPQMVSGPISRFTDLGVKLFEVHKFDIDRFIYGLKRLGLGLVKKMFIAAKFKMIADAIYGNPTSFSGIWIWLGMFMFTIELFMDFSGCMDIIIGVSLCFGIELEENFNAPFLSKTVQEFWQRWHITLGAWLRDYIMNPLLKSAWFIKFGNNSKKVFGKKIGKKIPVYVAMLFVWTAMGVWHGNSIKYVIGEGLWFWLIIVIGNIFEPYSKKLLELLHIGKENYVMNLLRIIRTFVLVSVGNVFFRADSFLKGIEMLRLAFSVTLNYNIVNLLKDYNVGRTALGDFVGLALWLLAIIMVVGYEIISYKGTNPVTMLSNKNAILRWGCYWVIAIIISFSIFGEQSTFIYAGF